MNGRVAVLTDSTAYLPDEVLQEYDIHVIPLIVNWGDQSYLDNVDITAEEFYDRLTKESQLPTTSQPSAGAFKEKFTELAENYDGVVAVLISEALSGTVASALAAKDMMSDFPIVVINSKLTTIALGFMAIEAAKVAQAGGSIDQVAEAANRLIGKIRLIFVVDTLEFLHKGGRIGGAKRLLGSLLAMKPILELKDGKIEAMDSVRTKKKALQTMVSQFDMDAEGKQGINVGVFHGVAEKEASELLEDLKNNYSLNSAYLTKLSPVIGVHTGPGTVGMAYYFDQQ